jgi:hypothetical protein
MKTENQTAPDVKAMGAALFATAVLGIARLYAADRLGFGDSEALYACYARHPQPVYLDHPGLIGLVARVIGGGDAPSPVAAHRATAVLATLAPWAGAWASRAAGASWAGSAAAALALMAAPEIAIGLFGMTPDLLLILLWYGALGAVAIALRSPVGLPRALWASLAAGFAMGLACDAKASGVLLLAAFAVAFGSRTARPHLRSTAPWAALGLALVLASPVAVDEVARGMPMLRHRLVDVSLAPSLRNVLALVGGQLGYVGPVLLWGAFLVGRDLWARRHDDAVSWWLVSTTVASAPLVILCLVSPVAEPHWIAPLLLALPVHMARSWERATPIVSRAVRRAAFASGAFLVAAAHVYVLTPLAPRLLGARYVPRYDIANDLYAWEKGLPLVRRALAESAASDHDPPIVVGSHWTVCAQLHAGLPASVLVGCDGAAPADFERWLPRSTWSQASTILYVTDDRFPDATPPFATRQRGAAWNGVIFRGGHIAREITIVRWERLASARR